MPKAAGASSPPKLATKPASERKSSSATADSSRAKKKKKVVKKASKASADLSVVEEADGAVDVTDTPENAPENRAPLSESPTSVVAPDTAASEPAAPKVPAPIDLTDAAPTEAVCKATVAYAADGALRVSLLPTLLASAPPPSAPPSPPHVAIEGTAPPPLSYSPKATEPTVQRAYAPARYP